MTIADEIKQTLKMDDLFRAYGLEPNRAGFVICPFHSEKTASLKAYADNTRFKCFGCGAQGDVISFVTMLFGLEYIGAIKKINEDFSLNLLLEKPKYSQYRMVKKDIEERKKQELIVKSAKEKYREYNQVMRLLAPASLDEPLHPLFIEALHNRDRLCCFLNLIERR